MSAGDGQSRRPAAAAAPDHALSDRALSDRALSDRHLLEQTLQLAELGRPGARPNPVVGALLARGDEVLATGFHARCGEAHVERIVLDQVVEVPPGATMYVSLEPCAHQGRQPACAELLLERGVQRVVIAAADSNPRTAGLGPQLLAARGVIVDWGPDDIARRATQQNAGFHSVHLRGRPYVTYKWAMTSNGRLATGDPDRRWVSGPASRRVAHELRAGSGAIAVGVQTVIADDPQLTARGPVFEAMVEPPLRVVYDRQLRMPLESQLVTTAGVTPTLVCCAADADPQRERELRLRGVEVWRAADGLSSPEASLVALAARGINDVLLESGPQLATTFFNAELLDALVCFTAPFAAPDDQPGYSPGHPLLETLRDGVTAPSGDDTMTTAILHPAHAWLAPTN